MEKVKYTRFEYRQEYLKSDEWKLLRETVMSAGCDCQCCKIKKASDVHHLVYRNIVDITVNDVIPVCRPCHEYIHQAIDDDYISQNVWDFKKIKEKTLNIIGDGDYIRFREWLTSKHSLREDEIDEIEQLQSFVIKKISALIRKNIWYDDLVNRKFTGRQIVKIRKIIQVAKYRRLNKMDIFPKRRKAFVYDKVLSLEDEQLKKFDYISALSKMVGFKTRKNIKEE